MPNFVTASTPSMSAFGSLTNDQDMHTKLFGWADDAFSGGGLTYERNKALQDSANAFTAQQNALTYERNKYLSDTQIQRGVADAKAAGLNPYAVLSQGLTAGGSTSGSGGHSNSTSANHSIISAFSALASGLIGGLVKANIASTNANNALAIANLGNTTKRELANMSMANALQVANLYTNGVQHDSYFDKNGEFVYGITREKSHR